MAAPSRRIEAIRFDEAKWNPFGWVPLQDTDPADGKSRLEFEWDDVHVNRIAHERSEVPSTSEGLVCEMLFRHLTHTQALLVLNCRAVIAVAPASLSFSDARDSEEIRAFLLEPLDALVLHRGTWHWGPFPVAMPRVELFNVQGLRYAEDNDCAQLTGLAASVEVLTSSGTVG